MAVTTAYPYINVTIDTGALRPKASRPVGNVAIVGESGGHGTAPPNTVQLISNSADAQAHFAEVDPNTGAVTDSGPLYSSILTALQQDPPPSRVYAVATNGAVVADYTAALAMLRTAPVQFVCLANVFDVARLRTLREHVETTSADGNRRMAVAMTNPDLVVPAGQTYAEVATDTYDIKSDTSRMILVAGRVERDGALAVTDVAAAAMGSIAGYSPAQSILLKQVRGLSIPLERQFTPSEVVQLSEELINPIFDPELIVGEGLHFGAGRTYTTKASLIYVDIVRVLDDIEFALKAGLIGSIGNVRIDRLGMQAIKSRIDGILGRYKNRRVIDEYSIDIPLLSILEIEAAARANAAAGLVTDARLNRSVEVFLSVTYAGSVHTLDVQLTLTA